MRQWILRGACVLALTLASIPGTEAANLPPATQKALAELKLDASILNGLDAELDVPKAWLDGAAKEGSVIILGTWRDDEFRGMTEAFNQRYPKVKLSYTRAGTTARGVKVVLALHEGRVIADVLTSIADSYSEFKKMNALADLRALPGIKNISSEYVASDGTWVSHKLSFRCMSYNTDLVKKEELPKTWDDLVNNPRWRGNKIALSDHPAAWLLALWAANGEKWGEDFTRRLFEDVGPQQRKEGMMALTGLNAAGEFQVSIPAPERRVETYAKKGAPISYHCPTPAPITLSQIVMLEKAKHKNGARVFINWLLSAEGQLMQYATSASVPVHKNLQQPRFIPFADTIIGKPTSVRSDDLLGSDLEKAMDKTWDSYWMRTGEKKKSSED
jgi:iron(III) transport system substrate-binding protein